MQFGSGIEILYANPGNGPGSPYIFPAVPGRPFVGAVDWYPEILLYFCSWMGNIPSIFYRAVFIMSIWLGTNSYLRWASNLRAVNQRYGRNFAIANTRRHLDERIIFLSKVF